MNYPKIVKINKTKIEAKNTKTIFFNFSEKVNPGQFFMIWIPGVDEIPMSVSYIEKDQKGITFRVVGDATEKLYELKKDDKIGIRGPFGNGFEIKGNNILFIGGGTGIAMLLPAIIKAKEKKIKNTVILGVKNIDELFFESLVKKYSDRLIVTTDDGSKGFKGFATDIAKELSKKDNYDSIVTCGPEIMMKKLFEIFKDRSFQASLERYMKCCMGLCGQCCVGEGLRVCMDGPIFDEKQLSKIDDFGRYKRDQTGKKIKI